MRALDEPSVSGNVRTPMLPRKRERVRAMFAAVAVAAVAALVAVVVRWPALTVDATVVADGQFGIRLWEVARASFARHEGFPLWDRSVCAGLPFLGNPDAQLLSSLFAALFGVHGDTMQRWYPTLGAAVAVAGTYAWGRRALELSRPAALFAGALFAASGFLGLHAAVRMVFVPFALIPWALFAARAAEDDVRFAALLGALLGAMLLEGGLYPFCFALVALAATNAPRLFHRRVGVAVVGRTFAIAAVVALLIGAIKIAPVLAQFGRAPRTVLEQDAGPWSDLIAMLGDSTRGGMPGRRYHVNEFRGYVGPLAFGMGIAGAGVALILKPRRIGLALLLLAAAVLTRGRTSDGAPWALLTKLPAFDQLQVPSRFVLLVDLAVAAAAGVALDAAVRAVKKGWLVALLAVAAFVALYDPIVAGQKALKAQLGDPRLPRPDPQPAKSFHLEAGADFARAATYPARNVGVAQCTKAWPYREGDAYAIGDLLQATLDPGAGSVGAVKLSSNEAVVDVSLARPSTLHLNQVFDPDFRPSVGEARRSPHGHLDIVLPAGQQHVVVKYRPAGFALGALGGLLGLVAIGALLVVTRRRQTASTT